MFGDFLLKAMFFATFGEGKQRFIDDAPGFVAQFEEFKKVVKASGALPKFKLWAYTPKSPKEAVLTECDPNKGMDIIITPKAGQEDGGRGMVWMGTGNVAFSIKSDGR